MIMRKQNGFTLVELLVVIAILILLFALLFPSLREAKYRAQVLTCTSQMRQWGIAIPAYANDHDGKLPAHATGCAGGNPWGIGRDFNEDMEEYGLTWEFMRGCPLNPAPDLYMKFYENTTIPKMLRIGYNYWVFRDEGNWCQRMVDAAVAGPKYLSQQARYGYPVLTDTISRDAFGIPLEEEGFLHISHSRDGLTVENLNHLYIDGHVNLVPGSQIEWRQGPPTLNMQHPQYY